MCTILIADDNIYFATNLMNFINKNNNNVRVCNISCDGKSTLEILNTYDNIDVALLDFKMPIYNADEILQKIHNKDRYLKSFIIISGEFESAKKLYNNEMVFDIINKLSNASTIMSKINELIISKENESTKKNIKKKIINELLYLGYDISHKGTNYLIEVINYIQNNPNKCLDNLKADVYPVIAAYHNESIHNIKCYINRETTEMYLKCDSFKLQNYFAYAEDTKPNVKTIINTIINKIS